MPEIHDTEFAQAWDEDKAAGQPDEGRQTPDPERQDDTGGEGADAERPAAAEEPTPDAERPAAGAEIPDEFAGLSTADLAAKLLEERSARAKAENTVRSHEGRLSRTERELNEMRGKFLAQPKPEPEQPQPEALVVLDDDTRTRLAEYDDIGPAVIKGFEALQARVEKAESLQQQERTQAAERELAQAEAARNEYLGRQQAILHEKYRPEEVAEIVASPAYAGWYETQPDWMKALVERNGKALVDGEAAAFVFDRFRTDTQPPVDPEEQRRQAQLAGSADVTVRSPAFAPSDAGDSGDYQEEWKRAAIEEKREASRR